MPYDPERSIVERSIDFGQTWQDTRCHPSSPLAYWMVLHAEDPYEEHDVAGDGVLYRWHEDS